jgi:hypothetical protein
LQFGTPLIGAWRANNAQILTANAVWVQFKMETLKISQQMLAIQHIAGWCPGSAIWSGNALVKPDWFTGFHEYGNNLVK